MNGFKFTGVMGGYEGKRTGLWMLIFIDNIIAFAIERKELKDNIHFAPKIPF